MNGPYVDEALAYGQSLGDFLNPPDEPAPPVKQSAVASAPGQGDQTPYWLQAQTPAPAAPTATPAATPVAQPPQSSVPATVTPSGNDRGPTPDRNGRNWGDSVAAANLKSQANLDRASQAAAELEKRPSAASQNAPLQQQRQTLAMPTPYRDPKTGQVVAGAEGYKPNWATRVARGLEAARKGGIGGVLDPASAGETPYGAPNGRYATAEKNREAQLANVDQQMQQNVKNEQDETARLKGIASEERGNATGESDIAKAATGQQNAESKEAIDAANAQRDLALAQKAAVPTTYEATVAAASLEKDPEKKAALNSAAKTMATTELKKFQYAAKAQGLPYDEVRQTMIDQATADIQKMNDFTFNPDANDGKGGFYDAAAQSPKMYTPQQFVDLKNQRSAKLDADLVKKKLQPLRVRFTAAGSTPGTDAQGNLTPPAQKGGTPTSTTQPNRPPTPAQANQRGEASYIGEPTQQEIAGGHVYRDDKSNQTIVLRDGKYRDTKTGKEVQQ